jgi:wobble nucleotide-excising tRNase
MEFCGMDSEITKDLYNKINNINSEISDIKVILAKQEVSLSEHIRRTEIAERAIEKNETALNKSIDRNTLALKEMHKEFNKEMAPVKQEIAKVHGMMKLIGIIIAVGSFGIQILQFFINK